jgi:hypothetical protein
VDQCAEDAGAGRADRVAERDRAAVDVDAVLVDAEQPHRVQRDRGERLVDLPQIDVAGLQPGLVQRLARGRRRGGGQVGEVVGGLGVGDDLGQHRLVIPVGPLIRRQHQRAGAVVDPR